MLALTEMFPPAQICCGFRGQITVFPVTHTVLSESRYSFFPLFFKYKKVQTVDRTEPCIIIIIIFIIIIIISTSLPI